jgi:hypothetical protein
MEESAAKDGLTNGNLLLMARDQVRVVKQPLHRLD